MLELFSGTLVHRLARQSFQLQKKTCHMGTFTVHISGSRGNISSPEKSSDSRFLRILIHDEFPDLSIRSWRKRENIGQDIELGLPKLKSQKQKYSFVFKIQDIL